MPPLWVPKKEIKFPNCRNTITADLHFYPLFSVFCVVSNPQECQIYIFFFFIFYLLYGFQPPGMSLIIQIVSLARALFWFGKENFAEFPPTSLLQIIKTIKVFVVLVVVGVFFFSFSTVPSCSTLSNLLE